MLSPVADSLGFQARPFYRASEDGTLGNASTEQMINNVIKRHYLQLSEYTAYCIYCKASYCTLQYITSASSDNLPRSLAATNTIANIGRGTSNSILSFTIICTTCNPPYLLLSQLIRLYSIINCKLRKVVHLPGGGFESHSGDKANAR